MTDRELVEYIDYLRAKLNENPLASDGDLDDAISDRIALDELEVALALAT